MRYPYKIYRMRADDHVFWVAESITLQSCIGQGDTQQEALDELSENEVFWLDTAKEMGYPIPEVPVESDESYSGKLTLRISPHEHRLAALFAKKEGISLNQYLNDAVVSRNHEMSSSNYIVDVVKDAISELFHVTTGGHVSLINKSSFTIVEPQSPAFRWEIANSNLH